MTVKELILKLSDFDEDAKINVICNYEGKDGYITEVLTFGLNDLDQCGGEVDIRARRK